MANITFIISGGTPEYTVEVVEYGYSEIFPAEGTYIISGDFSGCFTLRVTDTNGCVSSAYDCCPTVVFNAEFINHTCEQTWECDLDYNILEISFLTTTTTSSSTTSTTSTTSTSTSSTTTSTTTIEPTTTSTTSSSTSTTTTLEPTTTTTTTCDPSKCDYGLLYNWYAVNTGKLAPTGWHVPTDAEWTTLTDYLINNGYGYEGSGDDIAKSMASQCKWLSSSTPGTTGNDSGTNNSSGFSALPGGYRVSNGIFSSIGASGFWWSSTEYSTTYAWYWGMYYDTKGVYRNSYRKGYGFSVRCVRNSYVGWENDVPVVDYDGNEYDVVEIGTQLWLVQNLKTTHYNDGEAIPNVEDGTTWAALTTGALCAYNNDWETYACVPEPTTTTTSTTVAPTTTTTTTTSP